MTGAQIAAITLDTEGALVCERGNAPYRTYSDAQPDSKAAGAGDTFVSAFALSLLAGAAHGGRSGDCAGRGAHRGREAGHHRVHGR